MFDLVDDLSELIYVADLETYEMLYMNKRGKEIFGLKDLKGVKCYKALQNLECPCSFCTNDKLREKEYYNWEYKNPRTGRAYILKDKLIDWGGRKARVEIAIDTTEKDEKNQELKNSLDSENLVTECAKILYASDAPSAIDRVLEMTGRFLESERAYIFEITGNKMDNTYEWCAPGVIPEIEELKDMPVELIDRWEKDFVQQRCVVIEDLEELKAISPEEYEVLKPQMIHSLIAAPMYIDHQLRGYLGVDNYSVHKLSNAPAILTSIAYFVGSVLRHQRTLKELERISYCDTLTSVMNRNRFMRDLKYIHSPAERTGVVYIDINGMKELNDKYGHQRGDDALVDVAKKLRSLFRKENIYRVGGDEFIVLCQGIPKKEFEGRIQELKNLFLSETKYSVSIGSNWDEKCSQMNELIYKADERMYKDKRDFYHGHVLSGRYRRSLDDVLNMTNPGVLESMIDKGCFPIYYQAKVSLYEEKLIGAEALVRCRLNDDRLMPPNEFIPVLERAYLISQVDFYVFESVCRQIKMWEERGCEVIPVSVNFSRYTLLGVGFVENLAEIWAKTKISKELIEIEVTETVEEEGERFRNILGQIKEAGFAVSIDDFGVRSANLSLFTSVDFDVLKIDKSLIDNIAENEKAQAVISSISKICREMDIRLIIEGVETLEQLRILRKIRCDGVQGFLFSRPIPLEDFEKKYLL